MLSATSVVSVGVFFSKLYDAPFHVVAPVPPLPIAKVPDTLMLVTLAEPSNVVVVDVFDSDTASSRDVASFPA